MAVVEPTFAQKIHAIAEIPPKKLREYEVYGDLTVINRRQTSIWENLGPDNYSDLTFRVQEISKALATIETEIMRNDYEVLKQKRVRQDLSRVFTKFADIIEHRGWDILKRISQVSGRASAYIPIGPCDQDELPLKLKEDLSGFDITQAFVILQEDMKKEEYAVPCAKTYHFFYRYVIYAFSDSPGNNKNSDIFTNQLSLVIMTLFDKPKLSEEDKVFVKKVFKEFLFFRSYNNLFFKHLQKKFAKEIQEGEQKSPSEKLKIATKYIELSRKFVRFLIEEQLPKEEFDSYDLIGQGLACVWKDIPSLSLDPKNVETLKNLFSSLLSKKFLADPLSNKVTYTISEQDFPFYTNLLDTDIKKPVLHLLKFPGITQKNIHEFKIRYPDLQIVGIDDNNPDLENSSVDIITISFPTI